jgi:hypothetical protein
MNAFSVCTVFQGTRALVTVRFLLQGDRVPFWAVVRLGGRLNGGGSSLDARACSSSFLDADFLQENSAVEQFTHMGRHRKAEPSVVVPTQFEDPLLSALVCTMDFLHTPFFCH